jgi:hypothetical protein
VADHVAVRVNGEWCELPGIESVDHAVAMSAVEVEHTRLGRVWVVPRSFPMLAWPDGTWPVAGPAVAEVRRG